MSPRRKPWLALGHRSRFRSVALQRGCGLVPLLVRGRKLPAVAADRPVWTHACAGQQPLPRCAQAMRGCTRDVSSYLRRPGRRLSKRKPDCRRRSWNDGACLGLQAGAVWKITHDSLGFGAEHTGKARTLMWPKHDSLDCVIQGPDKLAEQRNARFNTAIADLCVEGLHAILQHESLRTRESL